MAVCVVALVLALLSYQPAVVLFAGFVGYALSGYVHAAYALLRRRSRPSVAQ